MRRVGARAEQKTYAIIEWGSVDHRCLKFMVACGCCCRLELEDKLSEIRPERLKAMNLESRER
jgi:hypothetical protein